MAKYKVKQKIRVSRSLAPFHTVFIQTMPGGRNLNRRILHTEHLKRGFLMALPKIHLCQSREPTMSISRNTLTRPLDIYSKTLTSKSSPKKPLKLVSTLALFQNLCCNVNLNHLNLQRMSIMSWVRSDLTITTLNANVNLTIIYPSYFREYYKGIQLGFAFSKHTSATAGQNN